MIENYRSYIQAELEKRQQKNSLFSLRAFANNLNISPAQLSQVISGKRPLTKKTADKLIKGLSLSPRESEHLYNSINPELIDRKKKLLNDQHKQQLSEDEFRLISDWYHFAILSLSEIKGNRFDAYWISKRLNISLKDSADARDRLLRLKLIERKGKGFKQTSAPLTTSNDIASYSIKRSHLQNLRLAQEKLESVDVSSREYTTVTMAVNKRKINEAKKIITEFKRKITEVLEEGEKTEVYTLGIQLFPLTNNRK